MVTGPHRERMPLPPAGHDIAERHALAPGPGFRLVQLFAPASIA